MRHCRPEGMWAVDNHENPKKDLRGASSESNSGERGAGQDLYLYAVWDDSSALA